MNPVERTQRGIQPWAILILCRCVLFFCGKTPLTTVYALGTLLSIVTVGILSLPLFLCRRTIPQPQNLLYRIAGVYTAAVLLAELYDVLLAQQAPYPSAAFVLILLAVSYGLTLPRRTTDRVAALLILLTAIGILVLLCRCGFHGNLLQLYTPARQTLTQCFRQAMGQNLPLIFLPLCIQSRPAAARRTCLPGIMGSQSILALLIFAGAWCNGRLAQWKGHPFLLLAAQAQGDGAIRTDGIWAVLITAAGITAVVFCLQIAIGRTPEDIPSPGKALLPVGCAAALSILFIMESYPLWLNILLLIVCLGLLPLYAWLHPQRGAKHES